MKRGVGMVGRRNEAARTSFVLAASLQLTHLGPWLQCLMPNIASHIYTIQLASRPPAGSIK
jgi:hypothetical protein